MLRSAYLLLIFQTNQNYRKEVCMDEGRKCTESERPSRESVESAGPVCLLTRCALLMDLLVKKNPPRVCLCVPERVLAGGGG